jgi:uncharacterized protein with NAD-binding domain and iron-sulfur cluster
MNPRKKKRQKVIIVGGGVAGLTAAHELIERDFEVIVYDRRDFLGGKAASVRVSSSATAVRNGTDEHDKAPGNGAAANRPGEHGFRFFPGWYKHLPDTMRRIPVRGARDASGDRTAYDHLVPAEANVLLQYERDPIPILLRSPKNTNQVQALFAFVRQMAGMGLPLRDVTFFLERLAAFLSTSPEHRPEYDTKSWWAFLDADRRSEAFRTLTVATTRTLLAAKAEEASAYTIALMAVRTLFDSPLKSDCVLDGPTSEVWINPWVLYLEGRGVQFECNYELDSINFDGSGPRIESLTLIRSADLVYQRQLRHVLSIMEHDNVRRGLRESLHRRYGFARDFEDADVEGMHRVARDELEGLSPEEKRDDADYYVFAIPVEQMAYYVNRSTTLQSYAPSLRGIVNLSASIDWMAGIQFYLRYPVSLPRGHIVCADSEWALTAVEQTQFWKEVALPANVQSIVSVDVSAWDKKGRFIRKEAFLCTREEIATEVWEQLKAAFNRVGEPEVLRDGMLLSGKIESSYYLDDNIVDRHDRKKQAAFAQGLDLALNRVDMTRLGDDDLLSQAAADPDAPFVFGERLALNVEPLLINRPGYLALRPTARTKIANLFLAADYVNTQTNLACMEGANEAARHAVNGILEAVGSSYERCKIWRFDDGELLARLAATLRFAENLPGASASLGAAAGALTTLGGLAMRATGNLRQLWKKT